MRILVVEDGRSWRGSFGAGSRRRATPSTSCDTGADAVWRATENPYDAIVLDVMLPGRRRLRRSAAGCARPSCWAPVLMLTARDAVDDRVAGLDAGADDYLTKPFAFGELLARLRALAPARARRATGGAPRRRPRARPGRATASARRPAGRR